MSNRRYQSPGVASYQVSAEDILAMVWMEGNRPLFIRRMVKWFPVSSIVAREYDMRLPEVATSR
jgi:hypothetical protein